MSLKNFFKPQSTPQNPSDDVEMHETHLPAPSEADQQVKEQVCEARESVDVEMQDVSQEAPADPSNSKENGGHLSP